MQVNSKSLLMSSGKKQYTLTVVLSPGDATCILTYDGVAHSATSATVDSGTVISYSITKSPYGTTTGTVTMDADKTLTATGTYSTSTVETSWTQPVLSENGTLGGNSMAVASSREPYASTRDVWKAFDGLVTSSSGGWYPAGTGSTGIPIILTIYTPENINITNLQFTNAANSNNAPNAFTIYGSNDNSNYTQLGSFTNTVQTANATWDVDLSSNTGFYQYYKIEFTQWNGASIGGRRIMEINITATQGTTSYTYYWQISIT